MMDGAVIARARKVWRLFLVGHTPGEQSSAVSRILEMAEAAKLEVSDFLGTSGLSIPPVLRGAFDEAIAAREVADLTGQHSTAHRRIRRLEGSIAKAVVKRGKAAGVEAVPPQPKPRVRVKASGHPFTPA